MAVTFTSRVNENTLTPKLVPFFLFCDKTRGTDVLFPKRNLIKHLFTLGYCCKNETATCSFITAVRIVIIDVYSDFCANKNINMPNFR